MYADWTCICGYHIDGLVHDCSISIASALEILQSCTKLSMCHLTNRLGGRSINAFTKRGPDVGCAYENVFTNENTFLCLLKKTEDYKIQRIRTTIRDRHYTYKSILTQPPVSGHTYMYIFRGSLVMYKCHGAIAIPADLIASLCAIGAKSYHWCQRPHFFNYASNRCSSCGIAVISITYIARSTTQVWAYCSQLNCVKIWKEKKHAKMQTTQTQKQKQTNTQKQWSVEFSFKIHIYQHRPII